LAGALQRGLVAMNETTTPIRHILVPHDFSDTAEHALAFALELAERLRAKVTIMHSYEVPAYGFPEAPGVTPEMARQIERAAGAALAAVAERSRRPGVDVQTVLRQGSAWTEIVAVAAETHANLLVMGTHGRRGFTRLLLGSVAEKVVRTAPCPVLTVHGPQDLEK
jgi:nucleotide-binding universal stress UspA family protein